MRKIIARDSETARPMELGISTCLFGDGALTPDWLDRLIESGFGQIELFVNRPHLDYHNRRFLKDLAGCFNAGTQAQIKVSLHLPFFEREGRSRVLWISALVPDERNRVRALDEIKRALEITDFLTISHAVIHLGVPHQLFTPSDFEHAYKLIDTINSFTNTKPLIENILNHISPVHRAHEFLSVTELSHVGICYDSGHGELDGILPRLDQVSAIHFSDNNGQNDEHLWPFEGVLNCPDSSRN